MEKWDVLWEHFQDAGLPRVWIFFIVAVFLPPPSPPSSATPTLSPFRPDRVKWCGPLLRINVIDHGRRWMEGDTASTVLPTSVLSTNVLSRRVNWRGQEKEEYLLFLYIRNWEGGSRHGVAKLYNEGLGATFQLGETPEI